MLDNLDSRLDDCLRARSVGAALDACLSDLDPEARQDLAGLVVLTDALRGAQRPALSAAASADQERRLLERARALRAASQAEPAPARWSFLALVRGWRLSLVPAATIFLLTAALVLLGGAGAFVSNARPDDATYNFKLSWEQGQLLLASNDAQRARVFLQIARNRLNEIELLAQDGQPIPEELLLQIKLAVNQAIVLSAGLSGRDAIPILRDVSELLSYERILLARFLESLPAPDRTTVELALQEAGESQQSVTLALQGRVEEQVPGPTSTIPLPTATPKPTARSANLEPEPPARSAAPAGRMLAPASPGDASVRLDEPAAPPGEPTATPPRDDPPAAQVPTPHPAPPTALQADVEDGPGNGAARSAGRRKDDDGPGRRDSGPAPRPTATPASAGDQGDDADPGNASAGNGQHGANHPGHEPDGPDRSGDEHGRGPDDQPNAGDHRDGPDQRAGPPTDKPGRGGDQEPGPGSARGPGDDRGPAGRQNPPDGGPGAPGNRHDQAPEPPGHQSQAGDDRGRDDQGGPGSQGDKKGSGGDKKDTGGKKSGGGGKPERSPGSGRR